MNDQVDLASDESRAEMYRLAAPTWGNEEYRVHAALFNDIGMAPVGDHLLFSRRLKLADYLFAQGWRRYVRPDDVTEWKRNE